MCGAPLVPSLGGSSWPLPAAGGGSTRDAVSHGISPQRTQISPRLVAPEELFLDSEDHDFLELEALAFVDSQESDRVHLRKAPERLDGVVVDGELPLECLKCVLDQVVEPGA